LNRQIQAFNFEGTDVRTHIDAEETIWWVLADICAVLEINNSRKVAAGLDDDQKSTFSQVASSVTKSYTGADQHKRPPQRPMTIINESGLWTVIMRSRSPKAKPFRRWVTDVVIPSIMRTGAYIHPGALPDGDGVTIPAEVLIAYLQAQTKMMESNASLASRIQELSERRSPGRPPKVKPEPEPGANALNLDAALALLRRAWVGDKLTFALKTLTDGQEIIALPTGPLAKSLGLPLPESRDLLAPVAIRDKQGYLTRSVRIGRRVHRCLCLPARLVVVDA